MLKIGKLAVLIFVAAHILALLTAESAESSAHTFKNAPFTDRQKAAGDSLKMRIASAQSALKSGLPSLAQLIADRTAAEAIDDKKLSSEINLIYIDSFIAQGEFENALKRIPALLKSSPTAENKIRAALAYVGAGLTNDAQKNLDGIEESTVKNNFKSWYYLAKGYVAYQQADISQAVVEFNKAKKYADNGYMLADAQIALNIAKLANNLNPDELAKMAPELADNVKIYMGTSVGFQFAKQYAAVLFKLGKFEEAAQTIEEQLQIELAEEIDRDELRLISALITRNPARQFSILRDVLSKTSSSGIAEYALALLSKNPEIKAEDFDALIDDILKNGSPKIRDKILLAKAKISVKRGDYTKASEYAKKLIADFPGSLNKGDALRILAWTSYAQAEGKAPEYRLAASYLMELAELEKNPEQARLIKLLAADCFRLSTDIQSAANIYRSLIGQFSSRSGDILCKAIDALLAIDDEKNAVLTLDKSKQIKSISDDDMWNAEWLLAQYMRNAGKSKIELKRIDTLLSQTISERLKNRFMWLKALLLRGIFEYEQSIKICDEILADKNAGPTIASSTMLMKAICLEALGKNKGKDGAIGVYENLRKLYPDSEAAQISYINQARTEASFGRFAEAQKLCAALAEKYPSSKFAYTALFDAAQYARKLGLDANYKTALSILDKLCATYPDNPRNFYTRLEQADILKLLNSFGDSRSLYNDIINKYAAHNEIHLAWLGLGDATLAQNARSLDAAAIFERLYSLPSMPPAAKAEAAFKWSFALERAGKINEANEVRWLTATQLLKNPQRETGEAYWIGRSLYSLAKYMESQNRMRDARGVYKIIVDNALPPLQFAKKKISATKE